MYIFTLPLFSFILCPCGQRDAKVEGHLPTHSTGATADSIVIGRRVILYRPRSDSITRWIVSSSVGLCCSFLSASLYVSKRGAY